MTGRYTNLRLAQKRIFQTASREATDLGAFCAFRAIQPHPLPPSAGVPPVLKHPKTVACGSVAS
jgi:hypothetical protein